MTSTIPECSSPHVCDDLSVRLLALELRANGDETYHVSFSPAPGAAFRSGVMRHAGGRSWDLIEGSSASCTKVVFGSPDEVFGLALGDGDVSQRAFAAKVTAAAPHWPSALTERLAHRRLSGGGTVAFDARWFLAELTTSAIDRPILFPNAASKLGLAGLERASAIVSGFADASAIVSQGEAHDNALAKVLLRALSAERTADRVPDWDGDGRLIGEYMSGELAQLGTDIGDGCRAAVGTGPLHVVFDRGEPLGLGLGPLLPADSNASAGDHNDHESIGMGVEVGEVQARGAAERAGVMAGMVLSRLSEPDLVVSSNGRCSMPFEAVLKEIDERQAAGHALAVTFDTAAAITHLYAVEMPAAAALAAFAAIGACLPAMRRIDVGVGAALGALCGRALLWREDTPRLFIGEAGSLTCAHTDICPQLELAHGLLGLKILGIASHDATPRLSAEHAGDEDAGDGRTQGEEGSDQEATRVPTDRPLTVRQSRLLCDGDVTTALLQDGDLAVFDSGALHFASNGADGLNCALYHGVITPAAVARLRLAAAKATGSHSGSGGAYRNHLFAPELLRVVEPLLAKFKTAAQRDARK